MALLDAARWGDIEIAEIAASDAESFQACLDAVAREQRYLALTSAPPLDDVRSFVTQNVANRVPQVVAKHAGVVVGWCDIRPGWAHALQHCGSLGMGVLPEYRGRGLGRGLLRACVALAAQRGITRVELEARADNVRALRLYREFGFQQEGTKRRGLRMQGEYHDTIVMGLLLPAGSSVPLD